MIKHRLADQGLGWVVVVLQKKLLLSMILYPDQPMAVVLVATKVVDASVVVIVGAGNYG